MKVQSFEGVEVDQKASDGRVRQNGFPFLRWLQLAWVRGVGLAGAARNSALGLRLRVLRPTVNINWESHKSCVLGHSLSQYSKVFEEVLKFQSAKHVEQKAFDGRGKPPWLSYLC